MGCIKLNPLILEQLFEKGLRTESKEKGNTLLKRVGQFLT